MLKLHRSSAIRSFAHQLWVVDTCQTLHDGARSRLDLPWEDFGVRDIMPGRVQEVLFAASPGERAANLLGERTGLFSRELLSHLKNSGGQWPPDVAGLADRLREQFTALRARGLARQTPTYLWFQDRTGREGQLLAAVSGSAGPQPPGEPVTPPPGGLAPLVDTLVAVPGFQSIDFRDELVTLLRQEIGNSIPRFNRARLEAASLVQTCARFPGGLTELQEAIRLCAGEVPEVRAFAAAVEAAG